MWNCHIRQNSNVRKVSAVSAHASVGSWPLTFASNLSEMAVHLQEDAVINIFPMMRYFTGSTWPFFTSECLCEGVDKVSKIYFEELKNH